MTANIDVTPGAGKTVGTVEIAGVQYQLIAGADASTGAANTLATEASLAAVAAAAASTAAVNTYPLPTTPVSGITAAMTGTASTAVTGMGAPGLGLRNYITAITVGNSHATIGTFVSLEDGSGGTVIWTGPAAALYGGGTHSLPTPLKQPTANTALYAVNVTTGANVIVSVVGYTAA